MNDAYSSLYQYVFTPILDRFHVPQADRAYLMAFYISGLMAIISEWLKDVCRDSIEHITSIIQHCINRK